ncbi:DUF3303 domain-containing protein [Jeongeupia naejangsanensis]|uniref:DUF3303 family protein n=1 Tax=Jeongeupia naejangsanensis TaxID=613195 RepID=A0ABS2BGP3_9NEIS|nr:DUF3303 family protein [Jeongeupia naejangsanensis]MBM3114782.1 DUF3303 family protein [Jeongeupia naejangsanensis]
MLFAVSYQFRPNTTEDTHKRVLTLFTNWQPPATYAFKAHYTCADGSGGLALVETDSAMAALEVHNTWAPFFEFKVVPVVETEKAVQIGLSNIKWRESI